MIQRDRFLNLCRVWGLVLCAGLIYAFVLLPRGWYIPCYFRRLTGYKCPGCGITTIFYHLLRGRVREALLDNLGLLVLSPTILIVLSQEVMNYLTARHSEKILRITELLLVFLLLAWGVLRNIIGL